MDLPLRFGLSSKEAQLIRESLGREPNLVEWGILSLNWSEHCSYKSSKLLLREFPKESERTIFTRGENAGVLELEDGLVVSFKVESHNHPSAVEPFHGAATGIGGIVRDILATGARPVALLDSLFFGPLEEERARWHMDGVVRGISFYGNSIGVPTVGGEVHTEKCYLDNPLVNVMCVGIGRKDEVKRSIVEEPGDLIILVGAPTGRDGIHGATFASEDLVGDVEEKIPSVQIGDPFYGKLLIESIMSVLDEPAVVGIQDLGAGGLSTAPAEMAYKGGLGVELDITKVPQRVKGMTPYEILLSESQERAILCVKSEEARRVIEKLRKFHLDVSIIGKVVKEKVFRVVMGDEKIAELPLELLFERIPVRVPHGLKFSSRESGIRIERRVRLDELLVKILSHPSVASKEWVYSQYDHTVGTNTILPPGAGNAAVLRIKGKEFGIAVTIDGNPRFSHLNPFRGAQASLLEAYRNIVSTGAEPIGVTDCLNFANPEDPETYSDFAQAVYGLKEAAQKLKLPVVSGNVSFYNQSDRMKVFPTVVVGMVGFLRDIHLLLTPSFKDEGELIYLIGKTRGNIGGSLFLDFIGAGLSGFVDEVDFSLELKMKEAILKLASLGLLSSVSDISEGGILTQLCEMAIRSNMGFILEFGEDIEFLFGEWQSRYIITFDEEKADSVFEVLHSYEIPVKYLGITGGKKIRFSGIEMPLSLIENAYHDSISSSFE